MGIGEEERVFTSPLKVKESFAKVKIGKEKSGIGGRRWYLYQGPRG